MLSLLLCLSSALAATTPRKLAYDAVEAFPENVSKDPLLAKYKPAFRVIDGGCVPWAAVNAAGDYSEGPDAFEPGCRFLGVKAQMYGRSGKGHVKNTYALVYTLYSPGLAGVSFKETQRDPTLVPNYWNLIVVWLYKDAPYAVVYQDPNPNTFGWKKRHFSHAVDASSAWPTTPLIGKSGERRFVFGKSATGAQMPFDRDSLPLIAWANLTPAAQNSLFLNFQCPITDDQWDQILLETYVSPRRMGAAWEI